MAKNLLIVESPAKAKTIEKYLGSDFKVKSSFGHIRDLERGKKGVNTENLDLSYVVTPEKTKVVRELKSWIKKVDHVWLATDEDREGEAISWHLCKVLGLDEHTTKRIVFREITKGAITAAVQNPRTVDLNVVDAQQARRVLDRLVGFELSEILWRKVRNKLSAGRVQSVAVRLIVEKEREIKTFESKPYFKLTAKFHVVGNNGHEAELKAEFPKKLATIEEARAFLNDCLNADFSISDIRKKPLKRKPSAPFTTSTLQQEASRKLYFNVRKTMQIAQRLYERGLITYMRTDSVRLSQTAMDAIADHVKAIYGDNYLQSRVFKGKNQELAQEAHEAIRPTYMDRPTVDGNRDEVRLYELIYKRTIASQMSDARLEKTEVDIKISTKPGDFLLATGQVVVFDGFLKLYIESTDEDEEEEKEGMLPPLALGQDLPLILMNARERFTKGPARYTEAGLVKKLEELGIGRPSTYAPTISKIMEKERGYVIKENRDGVERKYSNLTLQSQQIEEQTETEITGAIKNRLIATDMGMIVTDFLVEHFDNIMKYGFTADCEKEFDKIAQGKSNWKEMVLDFYKPFHQTVEKTINESARANGERVLGKHPETGLTVISRLGRYGPVVQHGITEELGEEKKPQFGNLKTGQSLETINLEQALELFKLPRSVGEYEGQEIIANSGRFGPYVKFNEAFISIPKTINPLEISLEQCVELIEEKKKADAPVMTFKGEPVTQGKGRFGPFLKFQGMFINIPRRFDPENLTQEEMVELINAKLEKEANRFIHKWDDLNLAVENGRWGPFIRFKKKSIKLPKSKDDKRMTSEEAKELTLEQIKAFVEEEIPTAFKAKTRKKAAPKKKTVAKKTTAKKK